MRTPLDPLVSKLQSAGWEPSPTGTNTYESRCPVHQGSRKNLSISLGDNGSVVMHCHHVDSNGQAGCSVEAVVAALGLKMEDLYPKSDASTTKSKTRKKKIWPNLKAALDAVCYHTEPKPVKCQWWNYEYADGKPAMTVARFTAADGEKKYLPYTQGPNGWTSGDPPGMLPLYQLPEVIKADLVYVTEGEKCADVVRTMGLISTASAHGANSAKTSDWSPLAGKDVAILPDNDAEGEGYAKSVLAIMKSLTPQPRVKVVTLPGLADGEDVADWAPRTREAAVELEKLRNSAHYSDLDAAVSPQASTGQVLPVFSGAPRPITAELLPVPTLDPRLIPDPLRPWLVDIAQRGCFPLEYPAAAAIVGLSGLIGRRIAVRPKKYDDWLIVPNLWGCLVGPSGIQKTPPVEEALRPLGRLAALAINAHANALKQFTADLMVADARKQAAEYALKAAAKKGASDAELASLAAQASASAAVVEPTCKRYLVNDATVEKLGEILKENPYGLTYFRDELIGFFKAMDRQGHEGDRGFLLESWNGFGNYTWDRIGRGTVTIPNVCLSIFGTIQPGPLARYLRGAVSGEDADGFIPRFQVAMYPDPPAAFTNIDRYPDSAAKNRAFDIFKAIDGMRPQERGCQVDQDRGIPYVGFCRPAQDLFDEWRVRLETRLRSGQENTLLTSHLAKFRKLLPALAGLFHLIEKCSDPQIDPISLHAVAAGAAWCELLEAHAKRIYQSALDCDLDAAVHLVERIKDGRSLPNPFTCWEVARKGWSGLATVEDARRAVGILEDRHWVKVVEEKPGKQGGRPSEKVWINPTVHP